MSKNKKAIVLLLVVIVAAGLILNKETYIRQGVDGVYSEIKMPLFVKWTEFLARHYEYARLAKEITAQCKGADENKALIILSWVRKNIKDVPQGMPIYDDHILNIIIKGYGTPEQFQDVFTTLCSYSSMPAFFYKVFDKDRKAKYTLSFVKIGNRWCVFDAYYGVYFRNKNGQIASIEDLSYDKTLLSGDRINNMTVRGVPYRELYYDLERIHRPATLRSEKQMPVKRIFFEAKSILGVEKEEDADQ